MVEAKKLPLHIQSVFGILDRAKDAYIKEENDKKNFQEVIGNCVILLVHEDAYNNIGSLPVFYEWLKTYRDQIKDSGCKAALHEEK